MSRKMNGSYIPLSHSFKSEQKRKGKQKEKKHFSGTETPYLRFSLIQRCGYTGTMGFKAKRSIAYLTFHERKLNFHCSK